MSSPRPARPARPVARRRPWHQARIMLLLSVGLTILLYSFDELRILAYPFLLFSTVAHELGHGVAAMLVGGEFHRFDMWLDGSGVARWSGEVNRLELAFIAAGGLVGPPIAAALGFAGGRTPNGARATLKILAAVLIVALLFVVRGGFGILFVTVVAIGCLAVALRGSAELVQLVAVFLAVQLALSVFSRGDYLFTPTAETGMGTFPSDVGQMAEALLLPYWFWGGVCGLISVAVLVWGLRVYWR